MDIKEELEKVGIKPEPLKDQFFLTDKVMIERIVKLAQLSKKDVVLEIGAGVGNLTRELAQRAGRVIALEIDDHFKPFLDRLPDNVEVRLEDAHKYARQGGKFRKKKEYNKIVANLPYSLAEWLLHNLAFVEYDKAILLVAKKFSRSTKTNGVFASFFKVEEKFEVPKTKFYPVPRTDSVVIELKRLADPLKTRNLGLFLRQYIYQREDWKVKNSVKEGLIAYVRLTRGKQLTQNQAKWMMEKSGIEAQLWERQPDNDLIYQSLSKKFDESLFKIMDLSLDVGYGL